MSLFNPLFPLLVTTDNNSPLDQSRGRLHLIDGNFFYSPNSRRDVQLPRVYDGIFCDPFKHEITEFHQPLWWHPTFPYLPFLPIRPVFLVYLFNTLSTSPCILIKFQ